MSKPRQGAIVRLLDYDPPKVAQVMELLSVQFTAQLMDGTNTLTYRFYAHENDTWRLAEGAVDLDIRHPHGNTRRTL